MDTASKLYNVMAGEAMKEIGQILQHRREDSDLSLDDISKQISEQYRKRRSYVHNQIIEIEGGGSIWGRIFYPYNVNNAIPNREVLQIYADLLGLDKPYREQIEKIGEEFAPGFRIDLPTKINVRHISDLLHGYLELPVIGSEQLKPELDFRYVSERYEFFWNKDKNYFQVRCVQLAGGEDLVILDTVTTWAYEGERVMQVEALGVKKLKAKVVNICLERGYTPFGLLNISDERYRRVAAETFNQ